MSEKTKYEPEDPYLTGLRAQLENAHREYDKLILSVSSGILAISAAFFHRTAVPHHDVQLLIGSWISLLVAIFVVATSLIFEQILVRHLIHVNGASDDRGDHLRTIVLWSNAVSGLAFVIGVVFLVVYLSVNVNGV